jgi:UDP-N-acetylmuramoylalanine--D-glutamate ligase
MTSVGILGGGESGVGAALLARAHNYEVFLSDAGVIPERYRSECEQYKIPFEEKGHAIDRLGQMDVIVKSPGIPGDAEVIRQLREQGSRIISEIEWGFLHCKGRILGITGSNGKTTTTMLCHHLLTTAGIDAVLCGNVGTGFCRVLADVDHDWYVLEISSFQLDDIETFRPDIGILLNITPDHLNRYGGDLMAYAKAKMRIAENMTATDLLVYNAGDALIAHLLEEYSPGCLKRGVTDRDSTEYGVPSSVLPGAHNALNAACAIAAARQAGAQGDRIIEALRSFRPPPHRMEVITEIGGVTWINDSKATNVDSVFYALQTVPAPVIWIAGGQDKGNDYAALFEVVREKVKMLICLGIDNRNLTQAFSSKVGYLEETTDMFEAVRMAASNSSPGDTVLLSPACASFDLFQNYMHRGDLFREAVLKYS